MIVVLLVYLGGVLTILSPCILPVLPFVFARSEQKFLSSGLPMLTGMAVTFAGIATLAAVGGAWAVRVNLYGRALAIVLLAAFAATLLSRRLADWIARPFVALGNRLLPRSADGEGKGGLAASLLLGVATDFCGRPARVPFWGLSSRAPRSPGRMPAPRHCYWHTRGRGDLSGYRHSRGRAGICRLETVSRHGRVDQARVGRSRIACRGRDHVRRGRQRADPLVARGDESARAIAHRYHQTGCRGGSQCPFHGDDGLHDGWSIDDVRQALGGPFDRR